VIARLRDTIRGAVGRAALRDERGGVSGSRGSPRRSSCRARRRTARRSWRWPNGPARSPVRLANTHVAPFAGLLSRRLVSPGAFLRAGDPIVELAAIDQVRAFAVPERHLAASGRVGDRARERRLAGESFTARSCSSTR
jgi:hypothetical protein